MPTPSSLAMVAALALTGLGHAPGPSSRAALVAPVAAPESRTRDLVGDLRVTHAHLLPAPDGGRPASAFVQIENRGKSTDTLVEASVDGVPHTTVAPGPLALGPNAEVTMGVDGPHLVLEGAATPFKDGDHVRGVLRFERGGPLPGEFRILGAAEPPEPKP